VHSVNKVVKFADDTYVIVPAENSEMCVTEVSHVNNWAERNNLRLRLTAPRQRRSCSEPGANEVVQRRYRHRATALNVSLA